MKFTFFTLLLLIPSSSKDKKVREFLSSLSGELIKYKEIKSVKNIDPSVFKLINQWKEEKIYSKYDEPLSEGEKVRFEFDLSEPFEPYNEGCSIQEGLPFRKLRFAANLDTKWILSYYHGQGRAHNNKLLFIDLSKPKKISVFLLWEEVENLNELSIALKNIATYEGRNFEMCKYIYKGKPSRKGLFFHRLYF